MKILISLALLSTLVFSVLPLSVQAKVERVGGGGFWDLIGSYVIDFLCVSGCSGTWSHQMNITSQDNNTGDFAGAGYYIANPGYTWDLLGNITDSLFDFTITYTGLNPGYWVEATGQVEEDGSLSGTATSSSNQTFTFETATGTATYVGAENHGQYVRSQEDKQEAAQSRTGMPVQSKGHTK